MQVMVKNPIEPLPGIKCMFITSLTKQILTTLAIWYSGNKPLKCGSISYQFGAQSRGQLCFQVCGGASEEFENVWAKWRSQWIRATRWQSLHVAGWLPGATWGAGRPPGPPHRLLHRPVRRGGRVHQKVGALIIIMIIVLKDVFLSSATFVPHFKMCIFFFLLLFCIISDVRWTWTPRTLEDGPHWCMHLISAMITSQISCWRLV